VSKLINVRLVTIILLFGVIFFGNIGSSLAQDTHKEGLAVTAEVDKYQYSYCELVEVQGVIYNSSTGEPIKAKVLIQFFLDEKLLYSVSTISSENGTYLDKGYRVSECGFLNLTVSASSEGYHEVASIIIFSLSYENLGDILLNFKAQLALIALAIVYFFIVLVYVTRELEEGKEAILKDKLFLKPRMFVGTQFIMLSIFAISILCILAFTPAPIGTKSPIGLVQNTYGNDTQWVLNLGGTKIDGSTQYLGGVQIPIYVIALSFVGAYVFFLNKVPNLVNETDRKKMVDESLKYLVRFFIAPLLAVALYLVLWQVEVRGNFILGAVSFATGLIIEEVTNRILDFAKDILGKTAKKPQNQSAQSNAPDTSSETES
jgi:hypothetical protein